MYDFFNFTQEFSSTQKSQYLQPLRGPNGYETEEKLRVTVSSRVNQRISFPRGKRFWLDGIAVRFDKNPKPIRLTILNKLYSDKDPHYGDHNPYPEMAHYPIETRKVPGVKGILAIYHADFPIPGETLFSVECDGGDKVFFKGWQFRAIQ